MRCSRTVTTVETDERGVDAHDQDVTPGCSSSRSADSALPGDSVVPDDLANVLEDLLHLHESGERVAWPPGYDPRLAAEIIAQRPNLACGAGAPA